MIAIKLSGEKDPESFCLVLPDSGSLIVMSLKNSFHKQLACAFLLAICLVSLFIAVFVSMDIAALFNFCLTLG